MYLSKITGNILNKFNGQKINLLYEPQRNLFDLMLSEVGFDLFASKNYNFSGLKESNLRLLNNDQEDLFNYNVGITNNIIGYSTQKRFSTQHLNTIIFTHSYKPNQIKKEDVVLLDQNLVREMKVFFSKDIAESWKLNNRYVYNYGIPLDKLYDGKEVRSTKVLLLNLEQLPNIEPLAQFLHGHGIEIDILNEIHFDIDIIRELFNKYEVCIDLGDHNIINLLCATACGCKTVTYSTPMIMSNYSQTPNLYTAKTVQDLITAIKQAVVSPVSEYQPYLEYNYSFNKFKQSTTNLINQANDEAYIL
ncbi:MAG: hypothetical protein WD512_11980 [Candidatus Paceibacterota bacterium]